MLTRKKSQHSRGAFFYIVAAGSLFGTALAVWPSDSQIEHFTVLFRVLPLFIVASARPQPK
jgi:hypothetical protein